MTRKSDSRKTRRAPVETFGHKLKSLRGARVLTQKELAARLQMDTGYLSRIENDAPNHKPCADTIVRISKALQLTQDESDQLFVLVDKVPPDVMQLLIREPLLLQAVRLMAAN